MEALQTLFLALAVGLFLFWNVVALIPRPAAPPGTVVAVLRYGRGLRFFALVVALAIPTLLAILMLRTTWLDRDRLLLVGLSLLTFSVLAGALLLEAERVAVTVTDAAVVGDSPWRRRRAIGWAEIERVTYSPLNRWFVIVGPGGRVVRASTSLVGLPVLLQALHDRVPDKCPAEVRREIRS